MLTWGSLTFDDFALHPEIATALNASKQTGLLILGQGRNGGLAHAQSQDDQAEEVQSNGKENIQESTDITLLRSHIRVLTEKVSSELGKINSKCN